MEHEVESADGTAIHVREEGAGAPVLFANSLGTDLRVWDAVLPLLPPGLRLVRYDMRGHGQSEVPPAPYPMGALVRDAEAVADALGLRDAVVVGLSVGGMVAQAMAVKRADVVRAIAISGAGVKSGTPDAWAARIEAVRRGGLEAIADATMDRWFARDFPHRAAWRARLLETDPEGYCGVCAAIAGTDLLAPTSGLRLPTLAIAGSEDGAAPPDLVRETAALIPGSRFALIRGAGHLPPVDAPERFAAVLSEFLGAIGHTASSSG
ncbi:3-oxoadipate enol-lactonase [Jannaschia sp. W003]|uniref:3-oxoadipate enol-lactonase n=1 Tax=Jannaschia sp. W003 TaxID=2867012 RepID=UPI0021A60D82|nr:3-oxoadipate enol-lactonase [Jannaschia sp. W003]UWQ22603.1 3-oxoadipate enol-lactonase [Jannaschia sp. W003]